MKTTAGLSAIVLVLCLFLSSCGKQQTPSAASEAPEEYANNINSTDCDRAFAYSSSGIAIAQTEKTIYYFVPPNKSNASFLWSFDKKTGLPLIVCGKADCSHTTTSCYAYFGGNVRCLSAYEGKLFWLGRDQIGVFHIYSCNSDGTGREEYAIENSELLQSITSGMNAFIHRGYVYYYGECSVVKNGKPAMESYLIRCSITGGAAEIVAHEPYDGAAFVVQAYKDSIFLVCTKSYSSTEHEIEITQIECDTLEKKSLYLGEGSDVNNLWVTDDGIYLSCADENKLYYFDYESQKITIPFTVDSKDAFLRHIGFGENRVALMQRNSDSFELLIRDFKGDVLLHKSYELEFCSTVNEHYISTPQGIDQESVYYSFVPLSKEAKEMLLCFPLDGSEPEVLWSEQ